jgi:hypothetical protein
MNDHDFSNLRLPFTAGLWVDADERMFHACFTILGQFVEVELGAAADAPDASTNYRDYRVHAADGFDEKAIDLWLWYRDELPRLRQTFEECVGDNRPISRKSKEIAQMENALEAMKDQKLREVLALRRHLWT